MADQFSSVFLNILLWFTLLELLSLASAPLLALALPGLPDKGFGLSKAFGVLLFGFLSWFFAVLGVCGFSAAEVRLVFLLLLLGGHAICLHCFGGWSAFIGSLRSHVGLVELLFFSLAALFLLFRFLTPEIFWGEKPMDFTFLNYFIRLESLPPQDPWAAGQTMQYYYLGTFIVAALHKLGAVSSPVGFNLAIASLPAFLVCGLYSVFLWLRPKRCFAAAAALGLTLLANLEVLRLALSGKKINFDLFWATTRGFAPPCFAEYPLWAFLFADLHAHVIAIPFAVLVLGLASRMCLREEEDSCRNRHLHAVLLGICWGVLFPLNSWDFLTYGAFTGLLCLVNLLRRRSAGDWYSNAFVPWFWLMFCIAAGGAAAVLPFMKGSAQGLELHYGWVSWQEFNRFRQIFMHLGQWLVLAAGGLLLLSLWRLEQLGIGKFRAFLAALFLALLPLALASLSPEVHSRDFPWSVAFCSSILIFLAVFGFSGRPVQTRESAAAGSHVFAGSAVFCAGLLITLAEFGFLFDRMNTVFKVYNPIWIFLGVGALFVLPDLWDALWKRKEGKRMWPGRLVALFVPLLLAGAFCGSALDVWMMTRDRKVPGPRPTLDGTAYLAAVNANEAGLIDWINRNVQGLPVLLEAWGESYREYSRISMHTGLPTVIGWEHHVKQRGTPEREVAMRKADVKRIYTTADEKLLKDLLRRYNIRLIAVGRIETEKYSAVNLRKFDAHPELFPVLYRQGDTALYGVRLEP